MDTLSLPGLPLERPRGRGKFKIDHSERSRASRRSPEHTAIQGAYGGENRSLSEPANHRAAGIVDAEIAELSAELVPEDIGARIGGHLVDFDRGAIGVDGDPADLDDRSTGRDLKPLRLGRQRHPRADVLTERAGAWPRSARRA